MNKYNSWVSQPSRFLSMTGYITSDFLALLPFFEAAHDEYLTKFTLQGKRRNGFRRFVIYANSPLPSHVERLCFILFYLKHNPIQELLAETFGMDCQQAHQYAHGLHKVLSIALEKSKSAPARTDNELQERLKTLDTKELLHDGTEREIPRPSDYDGQKENYSGKKKKHTVKNAVVATMLGTIIFLSNTVAGKVHDKKIADDLYSIPKGFTLSQDTGYQGYRPDGVKVIQPTKKKKGQELTKEEKEQNREISRVRVRIEHFIGGVKRYRIVKDECRAYKNNFRDKVMAVCTGLYNFRVARKTPQYVDNQAV